MPLSDPIGFTPRRSRVPGSRLSFERERELLWNELDALRSSVTTALRLRQELAAFLLLTIALLGVAQVVQSSIRPDLSPLRQMGLSWGLLIALLAPIGWFVRRQPLGLARLGLSLDGARESLREGALASLAVGILFVAYRAPGVLRGEDLFGGIEGGSLARYSSFERAIFFAAYGPHCFLQEFIARGVLQTSLGRLLPGAGRLAPVLVTSLLFGVFHLYVSLGFALLTFGVSALLGLFYSRHRSLLGVTLLHTTLGLASVAMGLN